MSRAPRRWGAALIAAALTLLTAVATVAGSLPASAGTAATGWVVRPLCATPRPGHAACHALRLVHGRALAGETTVRHPTGGGGPLGGYSPSRLAAAYGLHPDAKIAATQTVAIVDAYRDPTARADLDAFDRHYHLPKETAASLRIVNQHGKTHPLPHADEGWAGEIGLDLQAVRGICHRCRILLVEADSDSDADLAAAVNRAAAMGATEISNSYGGTEKDPNNTKRVVAAYDHPGIVITASTGDGGWYDWDGVNEGADPDNTPEIPAAYDSVVGVGGTSLFVDAHGRREGERVWNGDGSANEDGGSSHSALGAAGSGCSTLYRARHFQHAVTGYAGLGCGAYRSSVDVAAVADPATGYSIFETYPSRTGSWGVAGGTSLSSPLIAAMWALAGGSGGTRYPALSLYGHFASKTPHAHDVRLGGTGLCGGATIADCQLAWGVNPNVTEHGLVDCAFPAKGVGVLTNRYQCNARPGYDGVTGVGTPRSALLFKPLTPSVHVVWPARAHRGATTRFTVHATDPFPGGRIVRYTWNWGDGHVSHTRSGTATHRFRVDGRLPVTVKAVDNYGQSRTVGHRVRVTG